MRLRFSVVAIVLAVACADAPPPGTSAEEPVAGTDVARIVCEADGTTTLVTPQVVAQADGVHLEVLSHLDEPASLDGLGMDVDSGPSEWVLGIEPGTLGVACWPFTDHGTGDEPPTQELPILDPGSMYVSPELGCAPDDEAWSLIYDFVAPADVTGPTPGEPPGSGAPTDVAEEALIGLQPGDTVEAAGYPQRPGSVRVVREDRTIANVGLEFRDRHWVISGGSGCSADGVTLGEPAL